MISTHRGLGYKADAADERDFRYGASSAPSLPPVRFAAPDLSEHIQRVRDQGNTSSCVGNALAAAIEITSLATDGIALHVSARHLYAVAREAEKRGPLVDDGSFPRLAMLAASARGIVPEELCPFDEAAIDVRPSPALSVSAFDFRGLRFYRIDAVGQERVEAFDDALRRGCCILFGGPVSAQYQRNEGEWVDTMGTSVGGHMQTLVRCGDEPLILNSWSEEWGDRGRSRWSRDFLSRYPMTDAYAVLQVPHA